MTEARSENVTIPKDKIKGWLIAGAVIFGLGAFIPFQRDHEDDLGLVKYGDKQTITYNTIEKFQRYEMLSTPWQEDVIYTTVLLFSNNGVCDNTHECTMFYYRPQSKELARYLDDTKTKFKISYGKQALGEVTIYTHSTMSCYIYGLYCPNHEGLNIKQSTNYVDITFDSDAIVKEYKALCDAEDKKTAAGGWVNCNKDKSQYTTIKAKSLF